MGPTGSAGAVDRMLRTALLLILGGGLGTLRGIAPLHGQSAVEEVTDLRFVGNRHYSDKVLRNSIVTRETNCRSAILLPFCWSGADFSEDTRIFFPRELRNDRARLRLFYFQRGYRQAVVDTSTVRPNPGEVEVTFRIHEGDPVRVVGVDFRGLEEIPDSSVIQELPVTVGGTLNALALEAARDTLTVRLQDQGYAHADVLLNYSIPRDSPLEAQVTFDLYPGSRAQIGPISIVGNVTVEESVVRSMLPLREGRPYSGELILEGQRNLYNLDIFSFADITPTLDHVPDSIVPLMVRVAEGDVHRVRAGAGFSTEDCINTEARWASRNYFGGARHLQVTGRVSKILAPIFEQSFCPQAGTGEYGELNWLVSADFTQPRLFSPRNALNVSLYGERQSLPDIFVREALGLNVGVTHTLTVSTPLALSFRPQLSRLNAADLYFCALYLLCNPEDIGTLQGANWLAPIGLRFSQDRRNQGLNPTRGYALIFDFEQAADWTGSDFRYTRLVAEGSWYTQDLARIVLATRLRAGVVAPGGFRGLTTNVGTDEIVHPEKRLYAGGPNSVRGYAQNRLGPQVLYLGKVDDLLDPTGPVGCDPTEVMNLTCDAGGLPEDRFSPRPSGGSSLLEGSVEVRFPLSAELWEGATFLDFGQVWSDPTGISLRDLEFTPGLGVRYYSPIGPIRVDLAYRFDPGSRLQVVTRQIRPFDPAVDDPAKDRLTVGHETLDYVYSGQLAVLDMPVDWGKLDTWSIQRFQIHISIGQAF